MAERNKLFARVVLVVGVLAAAGVLVWLLRDEAGPDTVDHEAPRRIEAPVVDKPVLPVAVEPDRPAPPPPPSGPPRTGSAVGRVVNAQRGPVPGARIEALRGETIASVPGLLEPDSLHLSAVADAQGRFSLSPLPAVGDIVLRVEGNFAPAELGPFNVPAGRQTDLGDLVLPAGMLIAGQVLDPGSRPVEGARVGLYQGMVELGPNDEPPEPSRLVLTDAEGRFELPDARCDSFNLVVSAKGFARARVADGPQLEQNVGRMDETIILKPTRPLTGLVIGEPGGTPLKGALVIATALDTGNDGGQALSGGDGKFSVEDLAAGGYTLVVTCKGYSRANSRTAEKDPSAPVTVVLQRQGSLSGTVIGEDGRPVPAFDVQGKFAKRRMDALVPVGPSQRQTGKDGSFHVEGLDNGWAGVDVWAKGYALTSSDAVRVLQGQQVDGLVVQLVRGATLAGVVINDIGLAVPDAAVRLFLNNEPAVDFLRDDPRENPRLKATRTDADGRFVLPDLPPMTYQVEVDHPDHALLRQNDMVVRAAQDNDAGALVITRSGTIRGVALDRAGNAVPYAEVSIMNLVSTTRRTRSDAKGGFEFTRVAPGSYTLNCFGRSPNLQDIFDTILPKAPPVVVGAGQLVQVNATSAN